MSGMIPVKKSKGNIARNGWFTDSGTFWIGASLHLPCIKIWNVANLSSPQGTQKSSWQVPETDSNLK